MQFVIIFGQGRFLSRHVHQVILDIIDRAMAAFSATGMNPDRYSAHHFCLSIGSQLDVRSSATKKKLLIFVNLRSSLAK